MLAGTSAATHRVPSCFARTVGPGALTDGFSSGATRLTGLGAQSSSCPGSMTSCGWHGWPARSSRANLSRPARLPLVADQVSPAVTLAAMARQVFSLLPAHHPSVGAHRWPERVGSAFSHHLVQSPNSTEAPSVGSSPPGPRTDFASPSTDGLQGLRGACLARDRLSLTAAVVSGSSDVVVVVVLVLAVSLSAGVSV